MVLPVVLQLQTPAFKLGTDTLVKIFLLSNGAHNLEKG